MIAGLVTQMVMDGVLAHSRNKAQSVKKEWGFTALAVISGVIALSFLTSALYMGLSELYTAPIAALLTGLAIGLVSLGCLYYANRAQKKNEVESWMNKELLTAEMTQKMEGLLTDIEQPVKENPGTALLLATLAGFLTADKLH